MSEPNYSTITEIVGIYLGFNQDIEEEGGALSEVPMRLRLVLENDAWRDFETHLHEFGLFSTEKPLRGLGSDPDLIACIASIDEKLLDMLDKTRQRPAHRHTDVNIINVTKRPQGTPSARALRHLREKRPDLHTRVLAGELGPHRAMIEAGFRHRTVTVNLDSPNAAAMLVRKASPAFLDECKEDSHSAIERCLV